MRVALWGAYNTGFFSDDLIALGIKGEFRKHGIDLFIPPPTKPFEADFCIIGGGTILGTPLKDLQYNGAIGVFGAGYRDGFYLERLKQALFIKVRGPFTQYQLSKRGYSSEVIGDPIALYEPLFVNPKYDKCFIPRNLTDWRGDGDFDLSVSFCGEDNNLKVPGRFILPRSATSAISSVLLCKEVYSARLHPALVAYYAGRTVHIMEHEFNKVGDALMGLDITFDLNGHVYTPIRGGCSLKREVAIVADWLKSRF